jgi:AraC-like DNA-binding protein
MVKPDKSIQASAAQNKNLQIWDTATVQEKHRFSYFREAVCEAFLQISPEVPETGFDNAQVKRMSIADGVMSKLSAPAHRATRGKSELARIPQEYFGLNLQLTGNNIFRTGGHVSVRKPGDLTLNYCNQPFSIDILPGEPYTMIGLFFETSAIADFLKPNIQVENVNFSHHNLGPALIGCLSTLNRRHMVASEKELSAIYSASIMLVAASITHDQGFIEDITTDQPRIREGILTSIKGHIDDHIRDSTISPVIVAKRFGISVRYLHKLFSATQQSFSDYLLARRLEQAQIDLRNPAFDRLSISEIGYRSGFRNLASFHSNFKTRFGITPRQMRLIPITLYNETEVSESR